MQRAAMPPPTHPAALGRCAWPPASGGWIAAANHALLLAHCACALQENFDVIYDNNGKDLDSCRFLIDVAQVRRRALAAAGTSRRVGWPRRPPWVDRRANL